nr:hypothetical protein CFP56_00958 [Quercus suber]
MLALRMRIQFTVDVCHPCLLCLSLQPKLLYARGDSTATTSRSSPKIYHTQEIIKERRGTQALRWLCEMIYHFGRISGIRMSDDRQKAEK